jgi:predicted alpha/beta hydrolase family esterase
LPLIVTVPLPSRLCVPAAVVVIHGLGCATVAAVGPLLPADALTYTPAAAANRNDTSTELVKFDVVPEIE